MKIVSYFGKAYCSNGDVKLEDNGTPYVRWNGEWEPICGAWFWDEGTEGANLFCQKMGYEGGSVVDKNEAYSKDSFCIGQCKAGDTWLNCSVGCDSCKTGDVSCPCNQGGIVKISITCTGKYWYQNGIKKMGWNKITRTSCGSKYILMRYNNILPLNMMSLCKDSKIPHHCNR